MIRLLYGAVCVRIPMMMLSGGMSASPSSGILTCTGFGSHSDSPTIRPLPAAFAFGAFLPHIPDPPFRICAGRDGFMHDQRRVRPLDARAFSVGGRREGWDQRLRPGPERYGSTSGLGRSIPPSLPEWGRKRRPRRGGRSVIVRAGCLLSWASDGRQVLDPDRLTDLMAFGVVYAPVGDAVVLLVEGCQRPFARLARQRSPILPARRGGVSPFSQETRASRSYSSGSLT